MGFTCLPSNYKFDRGEEGTSLADHPAAIPLPTKVPYYHKWESDGHFSNLKVVAGPLKNTKGWQTITAKWKTQADTVETPSGRNSLISFKQGLQHER
jgi:hypothetical protein